MTLSAADTNYLRYRRAYDAGHEGFVKDAINFDKQYFGDQWDEADRNKLESEGRPALTINLILATLNNVFGEYLNQQAIISYKPARFASHEQALVMTKLAAQIQQANNYEFVEWTAMCDACINDRGWFDIRIDFDSNILGNVKIVSVDPTEIILPPDAKEYDPSTWPEITREYFLSLDEIEAEWGVKKRKEIENIVDLNLVGDSENFQFEEMRFGKNDVGGWQTQAADSDNRNIKAVKVISRQHRKMSKVRFFVDTETGDRSRVPPTWENDRIDAFAEQQGLLVMEQAAPRIRWTVSVDSVELMDDWSIYSTYSLLPLFPFFRRGRPFGYVRNLVNSQAQFNKLSSQELHVVNTTANSGYTVEQGTLTNMTIDELEERGAETGLVLEHSRGSNPPQKIQPNPIPAGLEHLGTKSRMNMREISGMEGVLGISSPEISGVALEHKQKRSAVQVQPPMMNLRYTRQLIGAKILELVQQFYTEQRILYVSRDSFDPKQQTEEMRINEPTPEGQILNDVTLGAYEVIITTQPPRNTFDDMQFAQIMQLRDAGVAVPDYMAVQYSTLADKFELSEQLKKMQGMAEPTEEEMQILQKQQAMAMEEGELQLQKLEAELGVLQSTARLNNAKAESQEGGDASPENQQKMRDLEGKIQMQREGNDLRRQLAQLSAIVKQQSEATRVAAQLASTRYTGQVQKDIAQLAKEVRTRNAPSK